MGGSRRPVRPRRRGRRRRLLTRALPLLAIAVVAFVIGAVIATAPGREERHLVSEYVTAWQHGNYARMYVLLDAASRDRMSLAQLIAAYRTAASTATLSSVAPVRVGSRQGDAFLVRVRVHTRLFGTLSEVLHVPLTGSGSSARVHFSNTLLFPGLRPGETLVRNTVLPPRATILASDGTPLAQGQSRTSPIPDVANQITGTLGPIPAADRTKYEALGYPVDAKVGINGLEHVFEVRLAGKPGGTLKRRPTGACADEAGGRPSGEDDDQPRAGAGRGHGDGSELRGDRRDGSAHRSGAGARRRGLLGAPASRLDDEDDHRDGGARRRDREAGDTFPIQTERQHRGLHPAQRRRRGVRRHVPERVRGVVQLGVRPARREARRAQSWWRWPSVSASTTSRRSRAPPRARSHRGLHDPLDVGSSAIGQDKVQATALEMTDVGATIAMGGRRPIPTLLAHARPSFVHVTSPAVASEVEKMMIAVVQYGTGTAAQIPGVTVAGKTGTAELRDTSQGGGPQDTDAWFVGYAPAGAPRIVVGALFPVEWCGRRDRGAGGARRAGRWTALSLSSRPRTPNRDLPPGRPQPPGAASRRPWGREGPSGPTS